MYGCKCYKYVWGLRMYLKCCMYERVLGTIYHFTMHSPLSTLLLADKTERYMRKTLANCDSVCA